MPSRNWVGRWNDGMQGEYSIINDDVLARYGRVLGKVKVFRQQIDQELNVLVDWCFIINDKMREPVGRPVDRPAISSFMMKWRQHNEHVTLGRQPVGLKDVHFLSETVRDTVLRS